jgi:hypothetical protein
MKGFKRFIATSAVVLSALYPIPAQSVSSNPNTVCVGSTCTVSFPFTGDYYSWTVPTSGSYILEVWGAQGGNAGYGGTVYTYGGKGGYAKGSIALVSGQVLNIYVGGQGAGDTPTTTSAYVAGGFNGGGVGYVGNQTADRRAGGGGGASDVRVAGTALADRVIVAGGGGGGSYNTAYGATHYPGVGGGSSGGDGYTSSWNEFSAYNGKGGSQSAGGAAGTANNGGSPGTLGLGGASTSHFFGGAGGGGGYYGGGAAGGGMAAGGGSGYVGGVTNTTLTPGTNMIPEPTGGTLTGRAGNGFARITYTLGNSTISLAVAGGVTRVAKGETVTLTATIDYAGKVTFFADGKKIPGCISLQSSIGSKTCNWKPAVQKSVALTARLVPTGASGSASTPLYISVEKRASKR